MFGMRSMAFELLARRARSSTRVLALASCMGWIIVACDLGLDVDALEKGCVDCVDATVADVREDRDASPIQEADAPDAIVDAGDAGRCPSKRGPTMVFAIESCMDTTEVTNAQYAELLATGMRFDTAPCDATTPYAPTVNGAAGEPVRGVPFCAARAYCAFAGKRLCGRRNPAGTGGALEPALIGRPDLDEWTATCSNDGVTDYPYGKTFDGKVCNGDDFGARIPLAAGGLAGCASADGGGPRDLSGNVWEWIDCCEPDGGACFAHGGAFNSPQPELTCGSRLRLAREVGLDTVGFRCCSR